MKKVLVTGAAGFIGYHTSKQLLQQGYVVVGIDNLNDYYDVQLKLDRLQELGIDAGGIKPGRKVTASGGNFSFLKVDLEDEGSISALFDTEKPDKVIHLGAQAGVRYSLVNPAAYLRSNVDGFLNILEGVRNNPVEHLVFASSSSVYGLNTKFPFSETVHVDHPSSLYAATKRADEMMAHSYAHLYKIPTTGLRFFTVYGPWGRPDMALFLFTKKILEGEVIEVYNHGKMLRDFTYIDDVVNGMMKVLEVPPKADPEFDHGHPDPSESSAPYRLFNIGNSAPVVLIDFVKVIEDALGIKARVELKPLQPGDVLNTYADISKLQKEFGYEPATTVEEGTRQFINWYKAYYNV